MDEFIKSKYRHIAKDKDGQAGVYGRNETVVDDGSGKLPGH
jgi:hypothetical protein